MNPISRRDWLKAAGSVALTAGAVPALSAAQPAPRAGAAHKYTFFSADEAAFVEAAVERLIPSDAIGPGAIEAGVPEYLDKQLAGAWGNGERLYRSGPWQAGTPSQGYQLPFTPAELFRNALRALHGEGGTPFAQRAADAQDAYLKDMQESKRDLGGVPASVFFDTLLSMTIEGYFGDPIYGGNKDMAAWRMIGFPGAYADYYHLVDRHGLAYSRAPLSIGEDSRGRVHLQPDVPAYLAADKRAETKS